MIGDEGSQITFTTADAEALQGVRESLRFQIEDLKTGDSKDVR